METNNDSTNNNSNNINTNLHSLPLIKRHVKEKYDNEDKLYQEYYKFSLDERLELSKVNNKIKHIVRYVLKLPMIEDNDERAKLFITEMYKRRIRSSTIVRYYNQLRRVRFFGSSAIKPNQRIFDSQKPPQERVPPNSNIVRLIEWCDNNKHENNRAYAILFAYYSGLRSAEICQLTIENLVQLDERSPVIALKCKTSDFWSVPWNRVLEEFIDELMGVYKNKVEKYRRTGIIESLFNMSSRVLSNTIRNFYMTAVGEVPPDGFGVHVMRYIIGTRLAQENDLAAAQHFLGHERINTTKRYVRYDLQQLNSKLSHIIDTDEFYQQLLA
ncbi:uncharacterized protein LOC130665636 [Microplitis mediator]|uniref:uncharacterized protein LOC130665636 n=1 Tax=Microplitis mediator TaxID=375433 RepID=UPI0025547518|nr:uncharacterized protein LOC130665636 [Microplitis mediator]